MRLSVIKNLKSVLYCSEKPVVSFKDFPFLIIQASIRCKTSNCLDCVSNSNFGLITTTEQLKKLDSKFNITYSTATCLQISRIGTFTNRTTLNLPFQRSDTTDFCPWQPTAIDPRAKISKQIFAQLQVTRNTTSLHPGLPFPCPALPVIVSLKGGTR